MIQLVKDQKSAYWRDGFVIIRNIIGREHIADLLRCTILVLKKFYKECPFDPETIHSWDDSRLHEALISFRSADPLLFGGFYDALQTSWALQRFFSQKLFQEVSEGLLEEPTAGSSVTGQMLRLDVPLDRRNTLDWHQDSSYYFQNKNGDNGLVILVPLIRSTVENGAVKVLVGSHREGRIVHDLEDKLSYIASQKFSVPKQILESYQSRDLVADVGDAVFCHMDLVHRSGQNTSDAVRLSAGIRVHRMLSDDFVPGRLLYKLNEHFEKTILSSNQSYQALR